MNGLTFPEAYTAGLSYQAGHLILKCVTISTVPLHGCCYYYHLKASRGRATQGEQNNRKQCLFSEGIKSDSFAP